MNGGKVMKKYNPLKGIPRFSYYITQFMDFETPEETRILFSSRSKQELVDLCIKNDWACYEAKNPQSGWYTHYIKYRP